MPTIDEPATVSDPQRLAALDGFGVLDTAAEQGFDDLVRLATVICGTPIALVTLVAGDRQWFKARVDLPLRETDLSRSVCIHALDEPDLMVITDLTRDPRTLGNPLVTGDPHIRFYAGAPLRSAEGFVLGTLCVIDREARPEGLTEIQADALRALARQAMAQFELRRAMAAHDTLHEARVRAEEQQAVLNHELSHRLKNTLAMVQAIATQTLRTVEDRDAVTAFNSRLAALSGAHDILLQKSWVSADMRAVVSQILALHAEMGRIALQGPELALGPKAVLSLSLLLHELATNAVKYGSLSVEGGRVALTWSVADGALSLTWRERGGPPVATPTRKGFGSRLIRTGLVGTGDAELRYREDGLHAEFKAPLPRLTEV